MESDQDLQLFLYLKPKPEQLSTIVHSQEYIKKGKRSKGQRRIYDNVQYDEYENEKIQDFIKECQKSNIALPTYWTKSDSLKIIYISKCKSKNYIKNLKLNLDAQLNISARIPSDINIAFLKRGIIYTIGRDYQFRPIIIMNLELVNLKLYSEEIYLNALTFFLYIIKKMCFVPGLIENWIVILDSKKLGITQFPIKALSSAISSMSINFCGCLDKLYLLNPSSSLSFSWSMISSLADKDQISKISFLKPKEYSKLQERIPINQLEEQFGGSNTNLTKFWPPINLDYPGGYPLDVLKQCDEMKVANIDIQIEVPATEEDEAKLQAQLKNLKIQKQEDSD